MNLFDVTRGIDNPLGKGPRSANDAEVKAYMRWQAEKRGLHLFDDIELEWTARAKYQRGSHAGAICIGATFGGWYQEGQRREYENGSYSILMPGHDAHRATVTMETLDDAGEVLAASTMPIEPKKGGVIWSKEDARKAAGPIAKPRAARKAKVVPETRQQEATGAQEALSRPLDAPEPAEALEGAEIAPAEPSNETCELPGDPVAALAARIEALEARLAALSVEIAHADKADEAQPCAISEAPTPTVAKRTPAHERAIRRAWAARQEARRQRNGGAMFRQMLEVESAALLKARAALERADLESRNERSRADGLQEMLDNARRAVADQREVAAAFEQAWKVDRAKRRRAVLSARDLQRRLYAEYRMMDKQAARHRKASDKLRDDAATWQAMAEESEARALRAETALAAVQARASGWPPAVRPAHVAVTFGQGAIAA